MTNAIIFDMDGVLTDSEPVINAAAIRGLREYGVVAAPEDFEPFVGMGEDRYIGGVAEKHGIPYKPEMKHRVYEIYLEILPGMLRGFPGVHELLDDLQSRGAGIAVASSADRIKVEANLAAIGIDIARFGAVVSGEDVTRRKPFPDIFLMAADKLGVDAGNCCVVEDAVSGVQAALAAGMRCVAVETSFPHAELAAAGATVIRPALKNINATDLGLQGIGS